LASIEEIEVSEDKTPDELIDGQKLTDLMIEYEAGVTVKDTIKICKIDADFFVEE